MIKISKIISLGKVYFTKYCQKESILKERVLLLGVGEFRYIAFTNSLYPAAFAVGRLMLKAPWLLVTVSRKGTLAASAVGCKIFARVVNNRWFDRVPVTSKK
ncbi:hypothetical protein FJY90_06870 [Candidatus Gottesmanbacteria bacterium]|nr:hypothetical protein [Candidatus Gottesmanbacteria bacterium]